MEVDYGFNLRFGTGFPPLSGADGRDQVRKACEALRAAGARVNVNCGLHVHHDMSGYDGPTMARAIETYAACQTAINWLVDRSRRVNGMCRTVTANDAYITSAVSAARRGSLHSYARDMDYHSRFRTINVRPYASYGTVEIRQHQGSLNARKILAWVDFGQSLFAAAAAGRTLSTDSPADLIALLAEHGQLSSESATYLRNRAGAFQARDAARASASARF